MPTGMFEYRTEAERQAIERAIAFVAELHDLARTAPSGHVLDQCEQHATDRGRELLRDTFQDAVQARIDAVEVKKGGAAVCVRGRNPSQEAVRAELDDRHWTHSRDPLARAVSVVPRRRIRGRWDTRHGGVR